MKKVLMMLLIVFTIYGAVFLTYTTEANAAYVVRKAQIKACTTGPDTTSYGADCIGSGVGCDQNDCPS